MTTKQFQTQLLKYAKVSLREQKLFNELRQDEFFYDMWEWHVCKIHEGCTVKDGNLYDGNGTLLCKGGSCMDEEVPHFVHQAVSCCGDYYGTVYAQVAEGTFVALAYRC